MGKAKVAATAIVDKGAKLGSGTTVWAFAQVGANAIVGSNCVLGNGCYIDREAKLGDNVKVMNKAQVFRGCEVGDNVFIGPGAVIANDKNPAYNTERKFEGHEWKIGNNVTIGANAVILPDVDVGDFALIGAGSIVTKPVPKHGLAYGNPARLKGFVCNCRQRMGLVSKNEKEAVLQCNSCKAGLKIPIDLFNRVE